jgi:hypothetical protein
MPSAQSLMPLETLVAGAGAIALVAVVVAWVALPLWRGAGPEPPPDPRIVGLLTEREATLAAIRDLDADLALGRIGADEHRARRAELVARGAVVLEVLDAATARSAGEAEVLAAEVEADVRARLTASASDG